LLFLDEADHIIWTYAHCSFCDHVEQYKKMQQYRIRFEKHDWQGDGKEDRWLHMRRCWKCCIQQEVPGCTNEASARNYIWKSSYDYEDKTKRVEQFKAATRVRKLFFKAMTGRKGYMAQLSMVTRTDMLQLFAPMAEFILIKAHQVEEEGEEMDEAHKLMQRISETTEPSEVQDLLDQVLELTRAAPCLAFKDQDDAKRKWMATTYADEWTGIMGGWFRAFFVCAQCVKWNADWTQCVLQPDSCATVMSSKVWGLKHADAMAEKQQWYCWCGKKYEPKIGMLVEVMTVGGKFFHCRTDCPPTDILDIRAMKFEK